MPPRPDSSYRRYGQPHLDRLSLIRHYRSLDMPLADICILLQQHQNSHHAYADVDYMLMHQLQKLQQRIGQMQQLEQQLIALKQRCDEQRTVKQCGIIEPLKTAKDDREWGHQAPLR